MTVTPERLRMVFGQLRDELTEQAYEGKGGALIWPFGLDILAEASPALLALIAERLNKP